MTNKEYILELSGVSYKEELNEGLDFFKKSKTLESYLKKIQNVEVKDDSGLKSKNELITLLKPLIIEFKSAEDSNDSNKYEELKDRYKEVLTKITTKNILNNLPFGIAVITLVFMFILLSVAVGEYTFISRLVKEGRFDLGNNSQENILGWVNRDINLRTNLEKGAIGGGLAVVVAKLIQILNGKALKDKDEEIKNDLVTALKKIE